jgi:hypothetical protein
VADSLSSVESSSDHQHSLSSPDLRDVAVRYPSNLRAFGLLLDRRNAYPWLDDVIKNDTARGTLQIFRRSQRFPFAVLAGELHIPNGGFVGGLADSWPLALRLFTFSCDRISEETQKQGLDICSGWYLLVNDRRQAEVRSMIAKAQTVGGHA